MQRPPGLSTFAFIELAVTLGQQRQGAGMGAAPAALPVLAALAARRGRRNQQGRVSALGELKPPSTCSRAWLFRWLKRWQSQPPIVAECTNAALRPTSQVPSAQLRVIAAGPADGARLACRAQSEPCASTDRERGGGAGQQVLGSSGCAARCELERVSPPVGQ